MPAFLTLPSCQVPFSPNAKSPVANSCHEVVWVLLITELGAYPFFTQSVQRVRAWTALAESSFFRSAPEPQNQGRNWKLPSSVPIAEKVMPFLPAAVTFCRASVRVLQSLIVETSTPAASSTFLL